MMLFDRKRVAITGAGSGIGAGKTALLFAREGARVALIDAHSHASSRVRDEILRQGGEALSFGLDVRDEAASAATFDEIATRWGGLHPRPRGRHSPKRPPRHHGPRGVGRVQDVNVKGVLIACQQAVRLFARSEPGDAAPCKIAMVASASASAPKVGLGAYATSKLALVQITRVLAAELASERTNVNAVAPGTIATPMISNFTGSMVLSGFKLYGAAPLGRMGEPSDVANAIGLPVLAVGRFRNGCRPLCRWWNDCHLSSLIRVPGVEARSHHCSDRHEFSRGVTPNRTALTGRRATRTKWQNSKEQLS